MNDFDIPEYIQDILKKQREGLYFSVADKNKAIRDIDIILKRGDGILDKELTILKDTIEFGNLYNTFFLNSIFNASTPTYADKMQLILIAYKSSKEKALSKVSSLFHTSKTFKSKIIAFESKFINSSLYISVLEELLNLMIELEEKNSKKQTTFVNKNVFKDIPDIELIDMIYESSLSLLDYSFYYKINYRKVRNDLLKNRNSKYFEILQREDKTIPLILDIINKINNKEIEVIDYYKLTKLDPYNLKKIVSEYNLQGKEIGKFIKALISLKKDKIKESQVDLQFEIDKNEIDMQTKKDAIDHLQQIDAPLGFKNYRDMVRKLVKQQ